MKQRRFRQIAFVIITIIMLFAVAVSVSAAKENFTTCDYIGIRNCTAPVAGAKPDYNVSTYSPGQYTIMSVNWYKGSVAAQNSVSSTMSFEYDTVYIVEFEVWAKDAYTFTTDSNGYTTVSADVGSGAATREYSATVMNVYGQDNKKYLTVRCTFPRTERNVTYINDLSITGIEEPYAGDRAKYPVGNLPSNVQYLTDNRGYYYDVAWYNGTTKMTNQDYFEEGVTYSCHMSLRAKDGYEFAADPNHYFAQNGKAYPTVTVTVNGKSATVIPDYSMGSGSEVIIISAQFTCEASRQITEVEIRNVADPKTGEKPNYIVWFGDNTYSLYPLTNYAYQNGVAWMDKNGNYLTAGKDTFNPSSVYTIEILLKAEDPYIFKYTQQGAAVVSATVNGNEAVVSPSRDGEKYLIVRYTFKKTAGLEVKKVEINDLEEPKSGNFPDYDVTFGDTTYTFQDYSNEVTVNGVVWYNDTTREDMVPGVDKFKGGNTYTVYILVSTTGQYTFKYVEDEDSWTATAKLNGKSAGTEEIFENTLTVWQSFTLPEDVHVCSPQKIDEVKATCTTDGKKEHYYCEECKKFFENEKCTNEIKDPLTWGILKATGHTGGKATCKDKAICKNCGTPYGELEAHKYGNGWDYKDENGHAHKCTVCGTHDTVVPHTAGEAKCGQLSKCTECKAEYGEVIQHKWGSSWEYTDSKGHARECTVCGDRGPVEEHTGGTADCQNKAKCSDCGTEYGKTGDHKWSTVWDYTDKKGHAHKCTVAGCDKHDEILKHTPGAEPTETDPQTCTACGYVIKTAKGHKHDLTKVKEVKPTCTENGTKQYYACSGCNGMFEDSKGNTEVPDKSDLVIPATGHDLKWKATSSKHWQICNAKGCDYEIEDSKADHQFGSDNNCTVCGYSKKTGIIETEELEETEPEETEPEETEPEETEPEETETPDVPDDPNETKAPDVPGADKDDRYQQGSNGVWFIVGAAVLFGVLCMVVMIVVLTKKNKK